jgi:hypothetical protein
MKPIAAIASTLLIIAGVASAKDLATYKTIYEKEMETIILSHGMKMTALSQRYTQSLDTLLAKVKRTGDLDKTTAVMEEIKRFGKEKSMPDKSASFLDMQNLQSEFTRQVTPHDVNKAKRIITLTANYDQALERLQRSLVTASELVAAKSVKEERRRVQETTAHQASKTFLSKVAGTQRETAGRSQSTRPTVARRSSNQAQLNANTLNGCVVWHSFDKKSKKSTDRSKLRNHGRVHNAEHTLKGKVGGAFRFSGSDSYIRIPNAKSVALKDAFTLIAWVKIEEVQAKLIHFIISRYEWGSGRGYGLRVNPNGSVTCDFNGKAGHLVSPPGLVESGKWTHLASVFDGQTLTCIVDGVAVVSRKRAGLINEHSDLFIGTPSNAAGHVDWSTLGLIDEVMIFNRALSVDEVSEIFSLQE